MQANPVSGGGAENGQVPGTVVLRAITWGGATALLLLPLAAMQFTREVNWTGSDFLVFGTMLLLACGTVELGLRMSDNLFYRAGMVLAAAAGFLLVWINLAVGVIAEESNPPNLMFAGVLLVGIVAALLGRFKARGMACALAATALAQALVGVVVLLGAMGYEALALCAVFTLIWLASAALFWRAEMQRAELATTR